MATPTLITVTGHFTKRDGITPETGTVVFQAPGFVRSSVSKQIISPGKTTAVLDEDGDVSFAVFATTDPAWNSTTWPYKVIVALSESRDVFDYTIPHDMPGLTIDLADMLPEPPTGGINYAPINHTHPGAGGLDEDEVNLIVQGFLADYVTLTALNAQNLVSYETLGETVADYLPKTNPEIINTNFIVRKADWSAAARWRSTGGAVDMDLAGTVVVSSFAGTPEDVFSGAQFTLQRWRAGSGVSFGGVTEFGTDVYTAGQTINGTTGVASLGAKNNFPNIPITGRRTVPGPPVTGTWALNDAVLAPDGWWICTGAGTPGTWTQAAYPGGGLRSGSRYAPVGNGFAASTIALNEIRYVPIDIKSNCTITELAAEVSTAGAATAVARFIVAKADPVTGRPSGALLYVSGQVATTALGKISVAPTLALTAGRHFFAILPQVVIASFRSINGVSAMYEQPTLPTFHRSCYSEYGVTGNPTTVGTLSMDAGDAPRVEALIA
jgi:hypothetical protein